MELYIAIIPNNNPRNVNNINKSVRIFYSLLPKSNFDNIAVLNACIIPTATIILIQTVKWYNGLLMKSFKESQQSKLIHAI